MDLEAVKSWYAQGLLQKDSGVLKPGSNRWSTLGQVLDLKGGASPGAALRKWRGARAAPPPAGTSRSTCPSRAAGGPRWRGRCSCCSPPSSATSRSGPRTSASRSRTRPGPRSRSLRGPRSRPRGRMGGGPQGRPRGGLRPRLPALPGGRHPHRPGGSGRRPPRRPRGLGLSLRVLRAPRRRVHLLGARGLALLPILAGGSAFVYFAYSPETEARRQLRESTAPDRRFADESLGVSIDVPRGWVILQAGNPLVTAPPEARVTLAHPRSGGFGFLTAESSPGRHRLRRPVPRSRLGGAPERNGRASSRRVAPISTWGASRRSGSRAPSTAEGTRFQESVTVWRDGWVYFSSRELAARGTPRAEARLEALVQGVTTQGDFAVRLQTALVNVTMEVPQLTPAAAEMLMGEQRGQGPRARPGLSPIDRGALPGPAHAVEERLAGARARSRRATYAALVPKDRAALLAYVARVRDRQAHDVRPGQGGEPDHEIGRPPPAPGPPHPASGDLRAGHPDPDGRAARLSSPID